MKRRADAEIETDAQKKSEHPASEKPKYSITAYLTVFVIAVLLMITLSYFVQQRNHSETISVLNEQFSTAQKKIEELQNANMDLQTENEGYAAIIEDVNQQIVELETKVADLMEQEAVYVSDYNELLTQYQMLKNQYEPEEDAG